MAINNLKIMLVDWVDIDFAQYYLAQSLGLMDETVTFHSDAKHVFWTDNPIGNMLANMLDELTTTNILEKRDEPDFQYRWNQDFRGSWERSNL
jgi:hypothetical protein